MTVNRAGGSFDWSFGTVHERLGLRARLDWNRLSALQATTGKPTPGALGPTPGSGTLRFHPSGIDMSLNTIRHLLGGGTRLGRSLSKPVFKLLARLSSLAKPTFDLLAMPLDHSVEVASALFAHDFRNSTEGRLRRRQTNGTNRQTDLIDIRSLPVETGAQFPNCRFIPWPFQKGSKSMTSKQIIAAVGMALIAVPAAATVNSTAGKASKSKAEDQKKYCLSYDNVVGSRVTKQECKTKAEWAKDRIDIDKMLKE